MQVQMQVQRAVKMQMQMAVKMAVKMQVQAAETRLAAGDPQSRIPMAMAK